MIVFDSLPLFSQNSRDIRPLHRTILGQLSGGEVANGKRAHQKTVALRKAKAAPANGALTAANLAPLVNGYTVRRGAQKAIIVPHASKMSNLQDVTVSGTLLKKQLVTLTGTNQRTAHLAANQGAYGIESDGDLHFDLGTQQLKPHVACELQNAKDWLTTFQKSVGAALVVSGFFRCLFEHPGFATNDDAHIFEIHPVRAVSLNGKMQAFDVDIPDQPSIRTWSKPHPLNAQDDKIQAKYDSQTDTLTFTGMEGKDENYVSVAGQITGIALNANSSAPATFNFSSPEIGKTLKGLALKGTTAVKQLAALGPNATVQMIALRNIDLARALQNSYEINLLAIDIKAQ